MRVRVRYFASLADRTGTTSETLDVPPGSDLEAVWAEAARRHPRLAEVRVRPLAACDMTYADWKRGVDGVEEIAFLPPVSGG